MLTQILYPRHIVLYFGTGCNLKCSFCGCTYVPKMDGFDFNNIYKIEKPIKMANVISLSAWGEPLLSPDFNKVLDYIFSVNNHVQIQMSTNGTLLSPQVAAKMNGHFGFASISINAATKETYNREMERGDFNSTVDAITSFVYALPKSDRHKAELHFCAFTDNFREIPELVMLAKLMGIHIVRVGNYRVNSHQDMKRSLLNVQQEYNAKVDEARALAVKLGVTIHADKFGTDHKRKCNSPLLETVIFNDGSVAPCCWCQFEVNGDSMGNVYKTSFDEVWFGDRYNELRKHPLSFCNGCPYLLPFADPRVHIPQRIW